MSWDKWRARLRGETVPTYPQPDHEDEGFYRRPITEKVVGANGKTNGQTRIIGWEPVAYYMVDGVLLASIGAGDSRRDLNADQASDLWTWCLRYPITEELYRAVAERGEPWPGLVMSDAKSAANVGRPTPADQSTDGNLIPAADRGVGRNDNMPEGHETEPAEPPEVMHARAIDNAIAAAVIKVTNDEEAAQAAGSKNRIAELRLAADKAGKAVYQPPFAEYKRLYALWTPMVAKAEKAEKAIQRAILEYRERERRRIAAERAEAEAKAREIEEANRRAADRAIARGEPEPPPEVAEPPKPAEPAPIAPTYGTRKVREELKRFAEIVNEEAVYKHFRGNADLTALLLKLAQAEVNAGRSVPGINVREGLI